ncbi:MAG: hypothetical protein R3320_10490 [Nitriliruptorales bacterium]|nr:hypothetical protein [Nitriliruptorales bacterium]
MTKHKDRPDALDRLLAGEAEDGALGSFLAEARSSLTTPADEVTSARHLAATVAEARKHAHTVPAAAPVTRTARWRGRVAQVFGYTATKIALGVGVAVAATGGLAATDTLPDPAQRVVSTGASYIGVDFPYPVDSLDDTPVEELPDPETGIPADQPADRSDSTRGAEVDAPEDDSAPVDAPAEEGVDDAPPVDPPADDDIADDPPAGEDERPEPPVDPEDPPAGSDDAPPGDQDDQVSSSSVDSGDSYRP